MLYKTFEWVFSTKEIKIKNGKQRLIKDMQITAVSRYIYSERLKNQSRFSFFTTTILSLGLIFIPLIQMANIQLAFSSNILSVVQIFLAIAVLVYSVIIGTSHYDIRSKQLLECGNTLKKLARDLKKDGKKFNEIQKKYLYAISSVENHTRNDYLLATLRQKDLYSITGIIRFKTWIWCSIMSLIPYLAPTTLLAIECIFILDIFNVTTFFTPYLLIG